MTYLVDTSLIIAYLRGEEGVTRELQTQSSDGLAASVISVAELYEGVFRSRDARAAERVLQDFLQGVDVLPVDEASAREFGRIRAQLRARGTPIGDLDILIAATALTHRLTLLTGDRDFARVSELDVEFR